jgi:hypothetical protein
MEREGRTVVIKEGCGCLSGKSGVVVSYVPYHGIRINLEGKMDPILEGEHLWMKSHKITPRLRSNRVIYVRKNRKEKTGEFHANLIRKP